MTETNSPSTSPAPNATGPATVSGAPRAAPSAGALLREAREAAGMSLDTVAQQLKLAPRQVTALEEGDFGALPGRTFVRGFLRNYARLVRVDPALVLAALASRDTPSLDSPALQPTAPTIGELPTAEYAKPSWTRWAIPLTLVAVIAAAAIYEFSRSGVDLRRAPAATSGSGEPDRAATPAPTTVPGTATPATGPATAPTQPGATSQSLPNPVTGLAAPATDAAAAPATAATPEAQAATAGEVTLVLTYQLGSWTEVKDGNGRLLLSQMVPAGQTRTISGTPPFDLVLGIASAATVTLRGKPVDLAPYTSKKVARAHLQ